MTTRPWSWPTKKVRRPNTRKRLSLRLADWPREDQARWKDATRPCDLFDESGGASHLKPKTRDKLEQSYGRWLGYLARTDPGTLSYSTAERVTPERIEAFCRELAQTNGARSGASVVMSIRHVLLQVAPVISWHWLLSLGKRIAAQAPPSNKTQRLRLSSELYQLGLKLMDEAEERIVKSRQVKQSEALLFRDGLLIALLAADPIRRSNLASLAIAGSLIRTGMSWTIALQPEETKGGSALEYPIPPRVGERIDVYLARCRPSIFGSHKHAGLWASAKGCPMLGGAIYDAICRRTKAVFGHSINPHLFRDAAATYWSIESPEDILGTRDLLGHKRISTTDTHYRHARTIQAAEFYAGVLERRLGRIKW